jgi:hypothetical protein
LIKRALVVVPAVLLLAAVSPWASARPSAGGSFKPVFGSASDLGGYGGSRAGAFSALPLHPGAYAWLKAQADAIARSSNPTASAPALSTSTTVSPSWNGIYQTGLTPPDANGAIGPSSYMETINTKFAIYSRTGSVIGSSSLAKLTGISGHALSDPEVKYDIGTGRFWYSAVYYDSLFLSDNGLAIGFSKTSNPKGPRSFCKYYVTFGTDLPDYPKLGDSQNFMMVGFNQFSNLATTYDGSQVFWLSKPPSGTACPAASSFGNGFSGYLHNADASTKYPLGTLMATPVPADLVDDSNGTGYVVGNADLTSDPYTSGANFLTLYTVTDSGGSAVFNGPYPIPTGAQYKIPPSAPQKGTSATLDTLDGRLEAATAAFDPNHQNHISIWTAQAVASSDGLRSEERWYEIDPSTHSLFNSGTVGATAADPSLFVWNGAAAPDRNGVARMYGQDMAMSVSTSSKTSYPAIQFVTYTPGGGQSPLTSLVTSAGFNQDSSCSPCRWGDYSGATSDPASPTSSSVGEVWLTNQYNVASSGASGTDWRTWNFAVTPG